MILVDIGNILIIGHGSITPKNSWEKFHIFAKNILSEVQASHSKNKIKTSLAKSRYNAAMFSVYSHGYMLFHHNTAELTEMTPIGGDIPYLNKS